VGRHDEQPRFLDLPARMSSGLSLSLKDFFVSALSEFVMVYRSLDCMHSIPPLCLSTISGSSKAYSSVSQRIRAFVVTKTDRKGRTQFYVIYCKPKEVVYTFTCHIIPFHDGMMPFPYAHETSTFPSMILQPTTELS
jgi:hypothetical protein